MNEKQPPQHSQEKQSALLDNISIIRTARNKDGSIMRDRDGRPVAGRVDPGWVEVERDGDISTVEKAELNPATGRHRTIRKNVLTKDIMGVDGSGSANEEHRQVRRNVTVGRTARNKDGSVELKDGKPYYKGYEPGWTELRVYKDDEGRLMSLVGKPEVDPHTGEETLIRKRVPTAEIDQIQEMVRDTIRYEELSRRSGRDALWLAEVPAPGNDKLGSDSPERHADEARLEELAQPLQTDSENDQLSDSLESDESSSEYDYLFNPDSDNQARSIEDAAIRKNSLDRVREGDIEAAKGVLRTLPDYLDSVMQELDRTKGDSQSMIDFIRTNHQARVKLLKALLTEVSKYPIRDNQFKILNHGRFEKKTTSQEATALLALSMLDGSFDGAASREDPIQLDTDGLAKFGKHRYAAVRALGLNNSSYAKQFIGIERES